MLLTIFFWAVQAQGEQWSQELEDQLCYEVKTLLLAGHETSASMLTWSVLELIQNPSAAEQVCIALITSAPRDCTASPMFLLRPGVVEMCSPGSVLWTLTSLCQSAVPSQAYQLPCIRDCGTAV